MRSALPVWGIWLSPAFDFAQRILVVESDRGRELFRFLRDLPERSITSRSECLRSLGVDVLICGAVSNPLAGLIRDQGICLIPWKCGPAEEVLQAFLSGSLDDPRFAMPGHRNMDGLPAGIRPHTWRETP